MIQRIQTIYLLLAAVLLGGASFLPLANATGDATVLSTAGNNLFADGTFNAQEISGWFFLLVEAAFTIAVIFLYKNRVRQLRITLGIVLLVLVLLVLFGYSGFSDARQLPAGAAVHIATGSMLLLPVIPLLLLAYRAIKKDENLVRSSDRLR